MRRRGVTARAPRVALGGRDRRRTRDRLGVTAQTKRLVLDGNKPVLRMAIATRRASVLAGFRVTTIAADRDPRLTEIGVRRMAAHARPPLRVIRRGNRGVARRAAIRGRRCRLVWIVAARTARVRGNLRRRDHVLAGVTGLTRLRRRLIARRVLIMTTDARSMCRCNRPIGMAVTTRAHRGLHERMIVVALHAAIVAGEQRRLADPHRRRQLGCTVDVTRHAAFTRRSCRRMRRMTREARSHPVSRGVFRRLQLVARVACRRRLPRVHGMALDAALGVRRDRGPRALRLCMTRLARCSPARSAARQQEVVTRQTRRRRRCLAMHRGLLIRMAGKAALDARAQELVRAQLVAVGAVDAR